MKTLQLSIIIGVCISIAAAALILTLNKQPITETNSNENSEAYTVVSDCTPAYPSSTVPITQWLPGKQVTTPEEALLNGEPIKFPKYLPIGYDLRTIALAKDNTVDGDRITILASKFPINSTLTN